MHEFIRVKLDFPLVVVIHFCGKNLAMLHIVFGNLFNCIMNSMMFAVAPEKQIKFLWLIINVKNFEKIFIVLIINIILSLILF